MSRDTIDNMKTHPWYIDYGATCHFTNKKDRFIPYVANVSSTDPMIFGSGVSSIVEGKEICESPSM